MCRYESEFKKLAKDDEKRYAFAVRPSGFMREAGVMKKMFI